MSYDLTGQRGVQSNYGKYLIFITGFSGVGLTAICFPFILPAFRRICLPYVPATKKQVDNIFRGLQSRHGSLIDLGSGDGRIVLEAAKLKFNPAVGVELNTALVAYSRLKAYWLNLQKKTKFLHCDLWQIKISNYDNIILFGVEEMMSEMERKFRNECKSNCMLAICRFPLPTIKPNYQIGSGIDTVWFYDVSKFI